MEKVTVWIGWEPRETQCFAVARKSMCDHSTTPIAIHSVVLDELRERGLYVRPTKTAFFVNGRHRHRNRAPAGARPVMFDRISGAPMSTEFAISRFLVPHLAGDGLAIFMDCDVLLRRNISDILRHVDRRKAVSVVQHDYRPEGHTKMDGQVQQQYGRKNWSSVMVFNCDHPANAALTPELINTVPGRDLHRFCWLRDDEIGELPPEWNYLVGHTVLPVGVEPAIVHFTEGAPCIPGFENVPYADEYRKVLRSWIA